MSDERVSNDSDDDQEVERETETNLMIILYSKIASSNKFGLGMFFLGWFLRFMTIRMLLWINHSQTVVSVWASVFYLLFERPIFILGATLSILPFLLDTPAFKPLTSLMASTIWYPFARLTYGAYLCHGIFMLYRNYNTE